MSIFGIDTAYYVDIIRDHWKGVMIEPILESNKY